MEFQQIKNDLRVIFLFLDELFLSDQITRFARLKSVSSFDCLQASFDSSANWQKFRSRQFEIAN